MNDLKIAVGADHAGFDYKEAVTAELKTLVKEIKDFGTYSSDSVDYPDFAHPVSIAVENKVFDWGILFCGSANGVAISANKHQGIRAAICCDNELAELARKHNNANIICIPARFIALDLAKSIIKTFLETPFEGGRHANRVNKISC